MKTENLSTLKIHKLTQAQYERERDAGRLDANALYLTPDEAIDLSGYVTAEQLDEAIDAIPTPDVSGQIEAHNTADDSHTDIRAEISSLSSEIVDIKSTKAVLYSPQILTDAQKAQARQNVGALSKDSLSLGIASDGLIYLFVDGNPVGAGIPMGNSGDVFGYVDENNTIVLNGNLADGTYSVKYEMENGTVVNVGNMVLDSNVYYTVTNTLTNCTSNNSAKTVVEGGSYSATITANSGYEMSSIKVTMGGTDISSSAVSGGKITIANVTGKIVITAVAVESGPAYTNLLPKAVDANGSLYNGGKGYKSGYKISTGSGNESSTSGACVSGFMPISNINDSIRVANITLSASVNVNNFVFYDANKTKIGTMTCNGTENAFHKSVAVHDGYYQLEPRGWIATNPAFFRFSCGGITDETIVTVNEPIDDSSNTQTFTNFADPTSADWKTGYRLSDDINGTAGLTGGIVTNYISVQKGDTIEVTGINIADSNSRQAFRFTSSNNSILRAAALTTSSSLTGVSYDANSLICTVAADCDSDARMRFSGLATGTSADVVIKIKRNGAYL